MSGTSTDVKPEIHTINVMSKKYKVILLNDNKTTFDFVVRILMEIFEKTEEEAEVLTFQVDREGSAVGGIYSLSVAEIKQALVHEQANEEGFPFKCKIEEV